MSKRAKKTMDAYKLLCEKPHRASQLQAMLGVSERSTYRILEDLKALGLATEISPCMYFVQNPILISQTLKNQTP
jgi:predicted DNA-binding transcriptional regulator YafY